MMDKLKSSSSWVVTTIDRLTLVLLPITFIVMNCLYWPYLLNPYPTQFAALT